MRESLSVRVSEVGNKKDSRAQAPVDTGDTTQQTSCIRVGVRCGLAKAVTQAQLGTDERPTCEATADVPARVALLRKCPLAS